MDSLIVDVPDLTHLLSRFENRARHHFRSWIAIPELSKMVIWVSEILPGDFPGVTNSKADVV